MPMSEFTPTANELRAFHMTFKKQTLITYEIDMSANKHTNRE